MRRAEPFTPVIPPLSPTSNKTWLCTPAQTGKFQGCRWQGVGHWPPCPWPCTRSAERPLHRCHHLFRPCRCTRPHGAALAQAGISVERGSETRLPGLSERRERSTILHIQPIGVAMPNMDSVNSVCANLRSVRINIGWVHVRFRLTIPPSVLPSIGHG